MYVDKYRFVYFDLTDIRLWIAQFGDVAAPASKLTADFRISFEMGRA